MSHSLSDSNLSEDLLRAIELKGYESLTPIQQAVLAVDSAADLRLTSVTGSGKTLAIGFALRHIEVAPNDRRQPAGPRAIIIVPTRELARQVQGELSWLFRERRWRIESFTGGTSIRDERRALAASPTVLVATPGRLLDHLRHGAIDTTQVAAVVLDEADRMLDMGFQEDLQAILDTLPSTRQTHMASATFCDEVGRLANRYQRNAILVRGTAQGQVNEDIEHVVHLVQPGQKLDAIVNLLLACSREQAIVFARTRADVSGIARELYLAGFGVVSLSGDMAQPARDRALATFRRGECRVLVATDVAARGLDIQGVTQIIHVEPPTDPDSYVHRSGRTGRAGNKGTSHVLVVPAGLNFVKQLMRRAGTKFQVLPIPTAESILAARDQDLFLELAQPEQQGEEGTPSARYQALAARLCEESSVVDVLAHLLMRLEGKEIAPRNVRSPRLETEGRRDADRRPAFKKPSKLPFGRKPLPAARVNSAVAAQPPRKKRKLPATQPAPW
jgi:ATP-dependent RNA helicase DeaD